MSDWEPYRIALISIARRVNPTLDVWATFRADFNWDCLICGMVIETDYTDYGKKSAALIDHGIQHLKERGLLPFV